MANLSSGPGSESRRRKPFPVERRPQMLKDLLMDDLSSCSSNGFRSFPRRACCSTVPNLVEMDLKPRDSNHSGRLMRSRSKAASRTITAFHKASEFVTKVVKHLPFSSTKALSQPQSTQKKQGILPRSLSRRLRRSFWKKRVVVENYNIKEIKVKVMIKDIIRWKSFRDLIEEKQQQVALDFSPSPLQISTISASDGDTTTITTDSSISSSNSKSNSWSGSDFTSEYSHSSGGSSDYSGENEGEEVIKECSIDKKATTNEGHNAIREDSMETTTNSADTKGDTPREEKEQFSPVSILDFPDDGETETPSSIHQSLANVERTRRKLMLKIRRFESLAELEPVDLDKRIALLEGDVSTESSHDGLQVSQEGEDEQGCEAKVAEDRAVELLNIMKTTISWTTGNLDGLLLDFFKEITMGRPNQMKTIGTATVAEVDGYDSKEVVKVAMDWVREEKPMALGLEYRRETYVTEMESERGKWRKFDEEQGEIVAEIESGVLGTLVDELLVDLFS